MSAKPIKEQFDLSFKIILIGDSTVGKSSILLRYARDEFFQSLITTIGIDNQSKIIEKTINDNVVRIRLQVWDTAGQERFRAFTTRYLSGIDAVIYVYDVTNIASFNHIRNWINFVKNYGNNPSGVIGLLVGNKIDLVNSNNKSDPMMVSTKMGQDLARMYGMEFIETSALNDTNIDLVFDTITDKMIEQINEQNTITNNDNSGVNVELVSHDKTGAYDIYGSENSNSCC